jgi:hypothetical protein
MSDVKCTKCGVEKTYADANIADIRKTCGAEKDTPNESGRYDGEEHDWVEIN